MSTKEPDALELVEACPVFTSLPDRVKRLLAAGMRRIAYEGIEARILTKTDTFSMGGISRSDGLLA